jgi:hypothetical protein
MELFKAHNQWKNRPSDERYASLEKLHADTKHYAEQAREKELTYSDIRAEAQDGDVILTGKAGIPARLTNWAFGQLASRIGAPASYLRDLPATLAVQNLNHGLAKHAQDATARLLFHANGSLLLRAFTGSGYERIWNHEVAERLLDWQAKGWEPARPDIRKSLGDFPALYASDHDMFVFLRANNRSVNEAGTDSPMWKGVIVENSEVGASALKLTKFLYRELCGNHIIWGASEVMDVSLRHVGSVRNRFSLMAVQANKWLDASVSDLEGQIERSKTALIAATKEEVLDTLFGKRSLGLTRKALDASYEAVREDEDGDPRTVWGFAQGVTRYSQSIPYADERTKLDKAAGKILKEANF